MDKIPTWEEMEQSGQYDDYSSMGTAFAEMHVKAALEAVCSITHKNGIPRIVDDKDSILNAYPLENIH